MSLRLAAACAALAALPALPAAADDVLTTADGIVRNFLCVGPSCVDPESFGSDTLKLKGAALRLLFEDSSTGTGLPSNDWRLVANDTSSGGSDYFALVDATSNRQVVRVDAGARANALYVASSGRVGLGTVLPQANLHIVNLTSEASIRLEGQAGTPYIWDIRGNESGFYIFDPAVGIPFEIKSGAPTRSFVVRSDGNVGLGLVSPQAALHVSRSNGTAMALIQESNGTTSPRTLLELQNNGRPEIVMANTDTGGEWSFGAGTNFILKQGAVGSASNAKTKLFEVTDTGNATLAGSLTTGGTACGTGCDRVFDADYPLPSIADHAARMQALGYLPNVGPTPEGQPIDVTDKLGRMLNELEHAHLYIAQLEVQVAAFDARDRAREAEMARLAATVAALATRMTEKAPAPNP